MAIAIVNTVFLNLEPDLSSVMCNPPSVTDHLKPKALLYHLILSEDQN